MEKPSDVDEILRKNLQRIIDERYKGNQRAFSLDLGFNPTYINAVVRGKKNLGKPKWEKILNKLKLRADQFIQEEAGTPPSPVLTDKEQRLVSLIKNIESAGMLEIAERYLEYLADEAKKKGKAGGKSASERVPRSRIKKRA